MSGLAGLLNTAWARGIMTAAVAGRPAAAASGSPASGVETSGQGFLSTGHFFQLLTAQLSHQDPLAPMNSTQFMSELAQLSTASGMRSLSATVGGLKADLNTSDRLRATALIGHYVGVSGNSLGLGSGAPAAGAYVLPAAAQKVQVTIQNAKGVVVGREALGAVAAGTHRFQWPGSGQPPGTYTFSVQAFDDSGKLLAVQPLSLARVGSVQFMPNGGVTLVFSDRPGAMPLDRVTTIF